MNVLIIGGTGYIGQAIYEKMPDATLMVRSLKRLPRDCKWIKGDLLKPKTLSVKEYDLIINLASVVRSVDKTRYNENVIGLRNLLAAMARDQKMIYFSTQKVYQNGAGPYRDSKIECEKLLEGHMIVRPNYVYGIDRQNDLYRMSRLVRLGIAPVIGSGNSLLQPVNKNDVAEIISRMSRKFKPGTYDISGPETVTINRIIDIFSGSFKKKPLRLKLPVSLLKPFSGLLPFDINSYDEDMIAHLPVKHDFRDFHEDLQCLMSLK